MPDSLAALEVKRSKRLEQFLSLGDLRPGSITAVVRRCGKPTCHCAQPNDPCHDPQFRLTRREAGKTVTETFPTALAQRKAQREIEEFRRYRQLTRALLEVNEKICRLRPVPETPTGGTGKKRPKPSRKK